LKVYTEIIDLSLDIHSDLQKSPEDITQTGLTERQTQIEKIFTGIGKSPRQFSAYTLSLTALGAMGYMAYKNDEGVNGFVNSVKNTAVKVNDRLMAKGVDVMTQTFTFARTDPGLIQTKFGGDISSEHMSLTANNMFSFRFNSSVNVSARFGLGVNVPLDPGSLKPDFGNMSPVNMGWEIRLALTF
jgi:hypothetical protein